MSADERDFKDARRDFIAALEPGHGGVAGVASAATCTARRGELFGVMDEPDPTLAIVTPSAGSLGGSAEPPGPRVGGCRRGSRQGSRGWTIPDSV